jgi:hypothetical protein
MVKTLFSLLLLKKNGRYSYTATAFVFGSIIVNLKLLFSGLSFHGYTSSIFNGSDYAQAMASLAALYVSNKHVNNLQINKSIKKEDTSS